MITAIISTITLLITSAFCYFLAGMAGSIYSDLGIVLPATTIVIIKYSEWMFLLPLIFGPIWLLWARTIKIRNLQNSNFGMTALLSSSFMINLTILFGCTLFLIIPFFKLIEPIGKTQ